MSIRSTPGPSFTPSASSPSSSTTLNTPLDASSSRRPTHTGSLAFSSISQPNRRPPPPLGLRTTSQASSPKSGTSTPNARRAKPQNIEERDWAGMEPDEVFRRLPVNEVKRVEAKMRGDALNKQSELRAMVGTRYRDLLTSATQITTLHSSSLHLSSSLRTVAQACKAPSDIPTNADDSADLSDADDVMSILPVAAHMKLLLDAPEALYSYLSHRAYLSAAFLWLVTRVVKEGISSMPEATCGAYMALLQKQWETLLPFRGQIVQRATVALRSREKTDPKILSETLLSIILLDNLALPEALSLLLSQRTKTVRDILAHNPAPFTTSMHLSPTLNRRRANSRGSGTTMSLEMISSVLTEAVQCLLDTINMTSGMFDKRKRSQDGESLIEEMVRLVQIGNPVASSVQQQTPIRRTSHQRRASRLASMTLPVSKVSLSSHGPPISTRQILQPLPSSQILLRHLPSSVTSFTPFITPSPPPAVTNKLAAWRTSSIQLLREAVPSWLAGLLSVTDIWHVRSSLRDLLQNGEFESEIQAALEAEWGARVKNAWNDKLETLVQSAEVRVREAGEQIRTSDVGDTNASTYMLSELKFPAAPSTSLSTAHNHTSALNTFVSTLKKRSTHRTPLLDSTLDVIEEAAASLKADMQGLPKGLIDNYREQVSLALDKLVQVLEKVLESMGSGRGDGKRGIEAELFVGRVALYLGRSSSFLGDIVWEAEVDTGGFTEGLLRVHATSTARWQKRAVQEAIALLAPLFEPHRGPVEVHASWQGLNPTQPSSQIMLSLHSLVISVRHLGLPPGVNLPVVADLVKEYVEDTRGLEGWSYQKEEAAAQAAFDLAFLGLLSGAEVGKDVAVQKLLSKNAPSMPDEFAANLSSLLADALRRVQLLLLPLLTHLDPAILGPAATTAETRGGLLRFGAPSASKMGGTGTEFRSPVAVARPGKRFGLLSIAA